MNVIDSETLDRGMGGNPARRSGFRHLLRAARRHAINRDTDTRMNSQEHLEDALKRLAAALDRLEAASARRIEAASKRDDRAGPNIGSESDPARLAAELDQARSRAQSLESANDEVCLRLKDARAAIEGILSKAGIRDA